MIAPSLRRSLLRTPLRHSLFTTSHPIRPFPLRKQLVRPASTYPPTSTLSRRSDDLLPPPNENSGPLLTRLPNRSLPTLARSYLWLKTLPVFILLVTLSSLAIFNYQKSSSSTVNSILYALRTNPTCREILGDEVYFASQVPWIWGELNQLQGRIDINFMVKGRKQKGRVRFRSIRRRRDGYFETLEWSLETEDGKVIQLLDDAGGADPFQKR